MGLNRKAFGWSFLPALLLASFYVAIASFDDKAHWTSVVVTAVAAFATVLGTTYGILKDVVGTEEDQGIVTREEFGWPFGRVVALATILLLVAMMLGLLVGLIAVVGLIGLSAQIGNNASSVGEVVKLVLPSFMGSVFLVGASYFVGRWIGYRCRDRVVVALVLAVVLARGIVLVLDMSVLGYEQYSELLSRFDASVWQFLASLGFFMGSGMIGVWRGRKTRASYYLHYVLQSMPQDSRNTLLELAHSEAVRLKGGRDKEEQIPPRGSSGYT